MIHDDAFYDRLQAVLEEYFQAIELGRDVRLADFCDGDVALRDRVQAVIDSESSAASLLTALERRDDVDAAPPVEMLGTFRLVTLLGEGGMGRVYLAEDEELGRMVAIKVLDPSLLQDERARLRFRREASITATLDDPHIVPIYRVGEDDGTLWIAMKWLNGPSLGDLPKPLDPREAARIGVAVARALEAAHLSGVIHRDVKPANVMLHDGTPHVVDFGLARSVDDVAAMRSHVVPGTLAYMAPEQLTGPARGLDPRADVYSLGATLYESLSGRRPFEGESADALVHQLLTLEPRRLGLAREHRDLETIVLRCLRKERDERFASAGDLADELERYLRGEPIRSRPDGAFGRLVRAARRRPRSAGAILVAALTALVLTAALGVRASNDRAALRTRVTDCRRLLESDDFVAAAAMLDAMPGDDAEVLRLARWQRGLQCLDELIDRVQITGDAQDLDALARLGGDVVSLGMTDPAGAGVTPRQRWLARCALSFAAVQQDDVAAARRWLAALAEASNDDDRAVRSLEILLDERRDWDLPPGPCADPDQHVFAATAMRLASAPVARLGAELDWAERRGATQYRVKLARALLLRDERQFPAAAAVLRALERPGRSNAVLHRLIGSIHRQQDDVDAALAELEKIPREERTATDVRFVLAVYWQAGRKDEFERTLATIPEAMEASAELTLLRVLVAQAENRWNDAGSLCERMIHEKHWPAHRDRALAEHLRSNLEIALREDAPASRLREFLPACERLMETLEDPYARSIVLMTKARAAGAREHVALSLDLLRRAIDEEADNFVARLRFIELVLREWGDSEPRRETWLTDAAKDAARADARHVLDAHYGSPIPVPPIILVKSAYAAAYMAFYAGDPAGGATSIDDWRRLDARFPDATPSAWRHDFEQLESWARGGAVTPGAPPLDGPKAAGQRSTP